MHRRILFWALFLGGLFLLAGTASAERGRIYGKIYTTSGDVLEGPIRWDVNEGCWDDMIDGNKEISKKERSADKRRKYRNDRDGSFSVFGLHVDLEGLYTGSFLSSAQAAVAFGFIKRLTVLDDSEVELLMKNGQEVILTSGATDLGTSVREIVIESTTEGELELVWDDIDYVEFFDGGDVKSTFGDRIYGTVTTDRIGEFTGWICWDMDEIFTSDIIDGREDGRKRKIPFEKIASIEKISSQSSEVTSKDGKTFRLDDSNDIDNGNRGISIFDRKLGRVIIEWDEFERLDIKTPPAEAYSNYDDYTPAMSAPLYGTVYDESGNSHTGEIRWDNDEEYGWEIIDGDYRDISFDIILANIKSIEKISSRGSRVILWDGRDFKLRESNDLNDENKGIFIYPKGFEDEDDEIVVEWDEFDRVEFKKK